ncbi:MAG: ribosome maturation factor [Bacteroidota bacterium]
MNPQTQVIEQMMAGLLQPHPNHFLVEVRIKPTNNIKVFLDGDEGINLATLIEYNRKLYRQLDETEVYPDGDFSLEVSSPGLDEPLKNNRQYKKNVGRYLGIVLQDGTNKEGKLLELKEDGIVIEWEEGKGKKKETKQSAILFEEIKTTIIQVKF